MSLEILEVDRRRDTDTGLHCKDSPAPNAYTEMFCQIYILFFHSMLYLKQKHSSLCKNLCPTFLFSPSKNIQAQQAGRMGNFYLS